MKVTCSEMEENANSEDFPEYSELRLGHVFWIL